MKPESADDLGKARQCLDDAKQIAAQLPLHHIVAREAYFAAYHAAAAYLFERTGKTAKTHRGLRGEFARLARDEPRIDREFLTFLAEAYEYKSIADYAAGPATLSIGSADARVAVEAASRFIDCIVDLLSESPGGNKWDVPPSVPSKVMIFFHDLGTAGEFQWVLHDERSSQRLEARRRCRSGLKRSRHPRRSLAISPSVRE
jgi:uncharacterized protein (UPF0332 family)